MDSGDTAVIIVRLVLVVLLVYLIGRRIFWLPLVIAKNRGISSTNQETVRLLILLGLFFGVTWIVALILACVYPPGPSTSVNHREFSKPHNLTSKSFDPTPESLRVENQSGAPAQEKCENCGRAIGKLETPAIWKNHIVCDGCYEILGKGKGMSA